MNYEWAGEKLHCWISEVIVAIGTLDDGVGVGIGIVGGSYFAEIHLEWALFSFYAIQFEIANSSFNYLLSIHF